MRPRIQSQNVAYVDTTKQQSINMYTFYSRGMGNRLSVGVAIGSEGGRMEERSAGAAGSGTRDAPFACASQASHRARSRSRLYSADRVGRDKEKFARVKLGSVEVLYLVVKNRGLLTGWYNLNQMLSKFGLCR